MLITKPMSKKYVFHYLNDTQYKRYARGIYLWATGMGVWGIVPEAATDGVKRINSNSF